MVEAINLPLQVATRPVGADGFSFIEATCNGIGHTHQNAIVGPAQIGVEHRERFPTHWVGNFGKSGTPLRIPIRREYNPISIGQIELAEVAEICGRKSLAITMGQLLRQTFDQTFTIGRTLLPLLKSFDHLATDVPVR